MEPPFSMLKITIVTPCFNQVSTIENTIRSVLDQDYPNLEYIVIDGGSTDGTVDVLRKYESRLHYWCSEPDGGQYRAVNKGFERGTGEVMAWLNGDDFYMPGALKAVGSMFAQLPQVDWLTTLSQITADGSGSCIDCHRIPGFSREAFLEGAYLPGAGPRFLGFVQQESTFWRRSLWEKAGPIDTRYELAGDFDLWARFFRHTRWLYCTPNPLGCFRYFDGQRSSAAYDRYLSEARESLNSLRQDVNWKPNRIRKLAMALNIPSITYNRLLPFFVYMFLYSLYQYEASTIVRRRRGNPEPIWEVRRLYYLSWVLSNWQPHYAD